MQAPLPSPYENTLKPCHYLTGYPALLLYIQQCYAAQTLSTLR